MGSNASESNRDRSVGESPIIIISNTRNSPMPQNSRATKKNQTVGSIIHKAFVCTGLTNSSASSASQEPPSSASQEPPSNDQAEHLAWSKKQAEKDQHRRTMTPAPSATNPTPAPAPAPNGGKRPADANCGGSLPKRPSGSKQQKSSVQQMREANKLRTQQLGRDL